MSWTIGLVSEIGGDPNEESTVEVDFKGIDTSGLTLLKYIDPYGDTVFNRLQITDLIKDLEVVKRSFDTPVIEYIVQMAQVVQVEEHCYLVFYGD